ncbi:MAG: CD225/dispanin family protein [Verrucomicrobiota bacterium]
MDWFYAKDGQQQGPVSREVLIELRQSGQISDSDLVWNESMPEWLAYGSVPELAGSAPAPAVNTDPSVYQSPQQPENVSPAPVAASSQASPTHHPSGGEIPNYLWQSIVVLLLCCWPLAIPAIVYSTKVNPAIASGDMAAAKEASDNAKKWCWIAFGVGLAGGILYLIFVVGLGIAGEL